MREEREFILAKDGLELAIKHWAVSEPNAVLCIVHGLGEHIARYQPMAEFLNSKNISVVGLDLRGHGYSQGKRGHAKNYEALLSDIEELLKFTRAEYTDSPIFLFGHSLGGNLAANYLKTKGNSELTGFIMSSPFFKVNFEPPKWKTSLAKMMGSIWPSLTQPSGLETTAISRIPEEVKKYEDDSLVHDKISVALYLSSTKMGIEVLKKPKELKIPGLMYHGTSDRLTSHDASMEFHECNKEKLKFVSLKEAYHEPHNDECRQEVYDMILNFIEANS